MHKRRHSTRDSCTICKSRNRNPTGHTATFCAYEGGPYEGNFHAAMTAARATKRCKSAAAPAADESILQLHASIETIGKEAKYLEERTDKIESGSNVLIHRLNTKVSELQTTVATQQNQIQTLMDTVQTLSNARNW